MSNNTVPSRDNGRYNLRRPPALFRQQFAAGAETIGTNATNESQNDAPAPPTYSEVVEGRSASPQMSPAHVSPVFSEESESTRNSSMNQAALNISDNSQQNMESNDSPSNRIEDDNPNPWTVVVSSYLRYLFLFRRLRLYLI